MGVEFEWSPLNDYDFAYAINDDSDKYWRCFYGHTFKRRLDVVKRGSIKCPYCDGKKSFQYFYLGTIDKLHIVLDIKTAELDFLSDTQVLQVFELGLNIRGICLRNGKLDFSVSYIVNMTYGAFGGTFDCLYNRQFIAMVKYYDFVAEALTGIFTSGYNMTRIQKDFIKYVS